MIKREVLQILRKNLWTLKYPWRNDMSTEIAAPPLDVSEPGLDLKITINDATPESAFLLERLADVLDDRNKADKFDLSHWARVTECGTSACAIGWAATDPWFIARGFQLGESKSGTKYPKFGQRKGWDAVCQFFEISEKLSIRLFLDQYYKNPRDPKPVIARLRRAAKEIRQVWSSEGRAI